MKLPVVILSVMAALFCASATNAAPSSKNAPRLAELKAKFEQRYPEVRDAKQAGKIGETSDGFLDEVNDGDRAIKKLVDDENTDRKELYKLLAEDQGIDSDQVAHRAAQRNFERAKKGEFLKDNGHWRQK
jgi:uncharacterized protein